MSVGKWNVEASLDIGSVKKATSELKNELKKSGDEVEKNFGKKAKNTIGGLENKIKNLKKSLNDVAIGSRSFKKISTEIKKLEKDLDRARGKVGLFGQSLGGLGKFLGLGVISYGIGSFIKTVASAGSILEKAELSFETLLGSQEKARQHLAYIDQLAKETPFSKLGIIDLNQQLLGFQFNADQALTITQVLGDSIAAVGGKDEDLKGVALALGQIQAKGKLSTEEVLQMAERGLPVFQILKEELGLTEEQIGNLGAAGIDSGTAINALLTGLNKKFAGAMKKQAQTVEGMWSNLQDNAGIILGKIGYQVQGSFKEILGSTNGFLEENMGKIIDFGADIFNFIWNTGKSIVEVFSNIIGNFMSIFGVAAGETTSKGNFIMKVFKSVFLFIAMGFQSIALFVNTIVGGIFGGLKSLGTGLGTALARAMAWVKKGVAAFANPVIKAINGVISGINHLRKILGKEALGTLKEFQTEAEDLLLEHGQTVGEAMGETWVKNWEKTKESNGKIIDSMISNLENYNTEVSESGANVGNVGDKINQTLDGIAGNYGNLGGAAKGSGKVQKEASEEVKNIIEELEKKYDDVKDQVRELEKVTEEYSRNNKKYYDDIIKDVEKLGKELKKAKKELEKELTEIEEDKNKDVADRYVDIKERELEIAEEINDILDKASISEEKRVEELEKINKQIELQKQRISEINDKTKESTKQALKNKLEELEANKEKLEKGEMSLEQVEKLNKLEAESLRLAKEKEFIEKNISADKLQEAERFNNLSKTEQILEQSEKKKKKAEEEFEAEKKKIENMIKINEVFYKLDYFNQKTYDDILKSEFYKNLGEEEKELLNKLAKEKLELESQKNNIIKMQEDISEKTRVLNEETTEKQLQNNDKLKKSYEDIISRIDKAIERQRRLNSLKGGNGYKEGGFVGFSSGGFTGGSNKDRVTGVVHEGEWVAPKWMVDKLAPLFQNLENQRLNGGNTTNITKTQNNTINVGGNFEAENFLDYAKWKL